MRENDDGAVLITVVVVMFLGFLIAVVVAGSVLFTIQGNAGNAQRTQAFIAAESGRDAAYASLTNAIVDGELVCSPGMLSGASDSSIPLDYTYAIRSTDSDVMPEAWSDLSPANDVCPTKDTNFVVVQATGSAAGSDATIDAVYPWRKTPDNQPAGTMAYFDGEFQATKSTYQGDLVIRGTGNYFCNNGPGNALDGDLWVLKANVVLSSDCTITGSVYAFGNVTGSSKDITIGGDIIAGGNVNIASNGVTIGGTIHSNSSVSLTNTGNTNGTVGGDVIARLTATVQDKWTHSDGSAIVPLSGQAGPVFTPTLEAVYEATKWLELTATTDWGSDTQPYSGLCSAGDLKTPLETAGPRAVFDMASCGNNGGKLDLVLGNVALQRDAILVVPVGKKLTVEFTGTITKGAGDPQLVIVQLDSDRNDIKPTCTGGSSFSLSGGATVSVRTMLYSPCGIGSSSSITLTGQLYLGNTGIKLNGGTFTCKAMSWAPAFNNLGCGVKGEGGIYDPDRVRVSIESLNFQAEH